jgi:pimeloyl-ACP methyl ester carboxylesterase
VRERTILTNGVRLHAMEAGPEDGPLVILLHGFPEFWYGWHRQIEPLATAGYRVLVPDQRGYNLSDKPRGLAAYSLDQIALDVVGLIDEAGREKAFLAGHDWGGAAAWWVGVKHPERLERLALLNCPHPRVLRRALKSNPAQRKKSWYIFYYQLPWLPERTLARGNFAFAQKALTATSRRGTFSADDLARYREAWSQPGALTGMINWYRAALRRPAARPESPRVTVPTLLVWGVKDRFLGRELAQASLDLCDQGRLVFLDDATHWLQHEEPEKVTELLRELFG